MMADGLLGYVRDGFAGMLRWPLFAWLQPKIPVRLIRAQGIEMVVLGRSLKPASGRSTPKAVAALLSEDNVLIHEILLPDLGEADIEGVVAGEVRANSPFAPESVVSGWISIPLLDGRRKVWIAMVDRTQVVSHVQSLNVDLDCEAWVEVPDGVIALRGFGGRVRARQEKGFLVLRLVLLLMLILQGVAIAVAPIWVGRDRAIQAIAQLEGVTKSSAHSVGARELLIRSNQGLEVLGGVVKDKVDVPSLIETLTHVLPDDASVSRLEVNGRRIKLMGTAANGTGLLDLLSAHEGFKDVKATSPISRIGGAKRDSYVIEFEVVDQQRGAS